MSPDPKPSGVIIAGTHPSPSIVWPRLYLGIPLAQDPAKNRASAAGHPALPARTLRPKALRSFPTTPPGPGNGEHGIDLRLSCGFWLGECH